MICSSALGAQPEFQETFLTVKLNGELVAENSIFLQQSDKELLANVVDLESWRINDTSQNSIEFQGQHYTLLKNISGLSYELNNSTLTVDIVIPIAGFSETVLFKRPDNIVPQGGDGAFLNYNLRFAIGDRSKAQLDSFWELLAFKPQTLGILKNTFDVNNLYSETDELKIVRLENTWSKDLISRRETISFGDTFTRPSTLARSVQYGGFKWESNFRVDPNLIKYPTGSITGFIDQQGSAQLFINDDLKNSFDLPRGPFDIHQLPNFTGDSNVKVLITDPLGREQVILKNFYISTKNLVKGLSEYSYEIGFLRQSFGTEQFHYGQGFLSATHHYGFNNQFTGGMHLELQKELQLGGLSAVFIQPMFGRISSSVIGNHAETGNGYDVSINYDYTTSNFNFGFGTNYKSKYFRQLGDILNTPSSQRVDTARFGVNLNEYGSFGLNYINQVSSNLPASSSIGGNYRLKLGFSTLIINFSQTIKPTSDLTIIANIIVPFSQNFVGIAGISSQNNNLTESLELQKNRGISDLGSSFRLHAETDNVKHKFDASLNTQTRYNRFILSGQSDDGNKSLRADMDSSIALIDNNIFFTRPIHGSFAVVDTGGVGDISIYSENHFVGKTDSNGQILIPRLNAYNINNLRLDPNDIPFDASVNKNTAQVAPYFRSGALVKLPVVRALSIIITVVDSKGKALPAGSLLTAKSDNGEGQVASKGRAYLNNLSPGEIEFIADTGMGKCSFSITISNEMGLLPDLGEVVCH